MVINEIYQNIILDHNNNPRNYHKMKNANIYCNGHNPLCGDKIDIFCFKKNKIIYDISFFGIGCAISKASASIMTCILKKSTINNSLKIFKLFHEFLINKSNNLYKVSYLKDLRAFKYIKTTPVRIKCAMLAWHTFKTMLDKHTK